MNILLSWLGRIAGIGGAALCMAAAVIRLQGMYSAAGFQLGTLFQAGTSAMTFACLCLLVSLSPDTQK